MVSVRRAHRDVGWPHKVGLRASPRGRPFPRQIAVHRYAEGSQGVVLGLQALQVEGKDEVVKVRQPTAGRRGFCGGHSCGGRGGRWRFLHGAVKRHHT